MIGICVGFLVASRECRCLAAVFKSDPQTIIDMVGFSVDVAQFLDVGLSQTQCLD